MPARGPDAPLPAAALARRWQLPLKPAAQARLERRLGRSG